MPPAVSGWPGNTSRPPLIPTTLGLGNLTESHFEKKMMKKYLIEGRAHNGGVIKGDRGAG